jgi:uncharacterized glyoxalase superfamily protein PhnB
MKKKRAASGVPPAVDASGEPVTLSKRNGFEIYPMPMFATLAVTDVAAVSQWYVQALQFGIVFQMPTVNGQPRLVHLRRGKYQDLLLTLADAGSTAQPPTSLTLSFQTEGVDALASRARAADSVGVSAIEGPVDTPWNTRDLRVTDPAGHRLVFTSRQDNPDPAQVERWNKLFRATGSFLRVRNLFRERRGRPFSRGGSEGRCARGQGSARPGSCCRSPGGALRG